MVTWQENKDFFKKLFNGDLDYKKLISVILCFALITPFIFLTYFTFDITKLSFQYFNGTFIWTTGLLLALAFLYGLAGLFIFKTSNPKLEYYSLLVLMVIIPFIYIFHVCLRIIIGGVLLITSLPEFYYNWEKNKPDLKLVFTLLLMLFVFLIGMMFIQDSYGTEDDTLFLNGCNNLTSGERLSLDCLSYEGSWIIWESEIECRFLGNKTLENFTGEIEFKLLNGSSTEKQFFTDKVSFVPPILSKKVYIKINETKGNETLCYDSMWGNVDFVSYDDYKEKKEKFFLYFITLLGIIFITIPLGIKALKEMNK